MNAVSGSPLVDTLLGEVELAQERLCGKLVGTRLVEFRWQTPDCAQGRVLLKREDEQISGSFKYRGALNKALAARERGVRVLGTASTGNHAIALSIACRVVGIECRILLPADVSPRVLRILESNRAKVDVRAVEIGDLESHARITFSGDSSTEYCSPYNDLEIIAGCASLGIELAAQTASQKIAGVVCATGGGGLAIGTKIGLVKAAVGVRVYAASPAASPVLVRAVERGWVERENILDTSCKAISGNIDLDTITMPLSATLIDGWQTVPESAIRLVIDTLDRSGEDVDPSAALAVHVAQQFAMDARFEDPIVAIMCGRSRGE